MVFPCEKHHTSFLLDEAELRRCLARIGFQTLCLKRSSEFIRPGTRKTSHLNIGHLKVAPLRLLLQILWQQNTALHSMEVSNRSVFGISFDEPNTSHLLRKHWFQPARASKSFAHSCRYDWVEADFCQSAEHLIVPYQKCISSIYKQTL